MAQILFNAVLDFFKNFVITEVAEIVILSSVVILCVWIPFCWIFKIGEMKK